MYDRSLTKTLQNIYYAVLKDMKDEDFKQAIKRLLQERVFATFPKPAEILELSAIKKVVSAEIDDTEIRANELITLVYSMNATVFENAKASGRTFEDELRGTIFRNIEDDIAILNNVKPYCEYKQLVNNISCYQTSKEQLKAFKDAIKQKGESLAIGSDVRLMLRGGK